MKKSCEGKPKRYESSDESRFETHLDLDVTRPLDDLVTKAVVYIP